MIVDVVIYVDGLRNASCPLDGVYRSCHDQGGFAWVGLYEPTEEEFVSATGEFDLHKLAVEDAIHAHQRPKVERYGDSVFVVLKSARYLEGSRTVEFGEIQAFVRPDFIVTVRHGEASSLHIARRLIENDPDLLRRGPAAVLYVIMDHVVDDYASVIDSLERDIDEIETEVFGGTLGVSRRIYDLSRGYPVSPGSPAAGRGTGAPDERRSVRCRVGDARASVRRRGPRVAGDRADRGFPRAALQHHRRKPP